MCCDQTVYKLKINKLRWIFTVWYTLFPSDSFFFTSFALFAFLKLQRYSYQRSCHTQEPNYQKLNRKCMDRNWTLAFCDFFLSLCNEVNNKFWQNSMNVQMEIKGWMGERENQKTKQEKKTAKKKVISFLDNSSCINILRCGQIYRRLLCTSFVNGVPFFSTVFFCS